MTKQYIYSYILSFFTVTTVLVYGFQLPTLVTGNKSLVREYYYTNYLSSTVLDLVLIFLYLGVAHYVSKQWNIQGFWRNLVMVALTTLCISGVFYLFFISRPRTSQFFSRWFHEVKHEAVIYDILLVSSVYIVSQFIEKQLN